MMLDGKTQAPLAAQYKAHQCKWFFLPEGTLDNALSYPTAVTITDVAIIHRLRTVLRYKEGQALAAVDGQNHVVHQATLTSVSRHEAKLTLSAGWPHYHPMPKRRVTLAVGLIKEQAWDWLLQKATELGVWRVQPLITERTVVRLSPDAIEKKLERWQAVIQTAAEQSEGLFLPTLLEPATIQDFFNEANQFDAKGVLLERDDLAPAPREALGAWVHRLRPSDVSQNVAVLIGPEGGLTVDESRLAIEHDWNPLLIPSRILKAETAALVALSQLAMA